MKIFEIHPSIFEHSDARRFAEAFQIGEDDLVFTHEFLYETFMKQLDLKADYVFQEQYGTGEPSDELVDRIKDEVSKKAYKRIVAIGGGTVIDISKLLVLENTGSTLEMFERKVPLVKERELVIVPTTCGTGSEVTNLSIVEIKSKGTKMGLGAEELLADQVVLIPELVKGLPYPFFMYSSIDALIHATESFVSPKANPYTETFSLKAIEMIIRGYKDMIENGVEHRTELTRDFLIASNYAGVAFGNAGVGAVHALSYPVGGTYHVPHGEINYQFFIEVFKMYDSVNPNGKIKSLKTYFADLLGLDMNGDVFGELGLVLSELIEKKPLNTYGMKQGEVQEFTDLVIETQQRLLGNNYVPLSSDQIRQIYQTLY